MGLDLVGDTSSELSFGVVFSGLNFLAPDLGDLGDLLAINATDILDLRLGDNRVGDGDLSSVDLSLILFYNSL